MKRCFLFVFLLNAYLLNAQNSNTVSYGVGIKQNQKPKKKSLKSIGYEISGTLLDTDQLPLESATVYLEHQKDSSLVTYTLTDAKGQFFLEGKTKHTHLKLNISYVGFKTYQKDLDLTQKVTFDLKEIKLSSDIDQLNAVVLKASPPITIKKDTVEFNTRSFKTKKDANVEDVLKKLPGIEVDEQGNITVNGKPVNKVLINGKPFFGNDPTIATKNFPKDIIEKIQIVDTKTKSQAFTGEQSEDENKTINLVVKKENNKGVFGRTAAGIGTDNRYQYAGMYNRFDNDQKISLLAGGNNINSPGFSYGEIRDMFGSNSDISSYSLGRGNGITTSDNAGVNYADNYGKNVEFNSSYLYTQSDSKNTYTSESEETLDETTSYFTDYESTSSTVENKHAANLEFDIKRDSTWLINIVPKFDFKENIYTNNREYETLNTVQDTVNTYNGILTNDTQEGIFSTNLSVTKNYGSDGGFVRIKTSVKATSETGDKFDNSETVFFENASNNENRDQQTKINNSSQNIQGSFTYRIPILSKKLYFDIKHTYERNQNNRDQKTYDFNDNSLQRDLLNDILSTDYTNTIQSNVPGVSLSYRVKKFSIRFSHYYRFRTLEYNDDLRPDISIKKDYNTAEHFARFRYRFNDRSSVYFRYNYQKNPPNVRYLQAYENVSNTSNTIIGNPDLKPETSHNFYMNFNYYNDQKEYGFNGYIYGDLVQDKSVSRTDISSDNHRTTNYTNVDGNYYASGRIEATKKFKFTDDSSLSLQLGVRPRYRKNVNYNNAILYSSLVTSIEPSLNLRYDWRNVLEVNTRYNPRYSNTTYNLSTLDNQKFTTHQFSLNTTTRVPKKLEWSNSLNYNYNPNVSDGFQKSSWFWNMTMTYSVLKDKGLISLKAFDILNQNTNAQRHAYGNTISDSRNTVLQQYFMLGFSWKFNTLGKKGKRRTRHQKF